MMLVVMILSDQSVIYMVFYSILKGQVTKMQSCHHLLTLMPFRTCMTLFLKSTIQVFW